MPFGEGIISACIQCNVKMHFQTIVTFCNCYSYHYLTCVESPLYVYPDLLSAKTKAFIPHFVGLLRRYCIKPRQPLNPIMDFFYRCFPSQSVGLLEVEEKRVKKGAKLVQGIISWLSFRDVFGAVVQVEKPHQERETIT